MFFFFGGRPSARGLSESGAPSLSLSLSLSLYIYFLPPLLVTHRHAQRMESSQRERPALVPWDVSAILHFGGVLFSLSFAADRKANGLLSPSLIFFFFLDSSPEKTTVDDKRPLPVPPREDEHGEERGEERRAAAAAAAATTTAGATSTTALLLLPPHNLRSLPQRHQPTTIHQKQRKKK